MAQAKVIIREVPTESGVSQRPALQEILDFHSSSIKEILEGIVQIEKDKFKEENREVRKSGDWDLAIGWNESKSDTINYYIEGIIKKL